MVTISAATRAAVTAVVLSATAVGPTGPVLLQSFAFACHDRAPGPAVGLAAGIALGLAVSAAVGGEATTAADALGSLELTLGSLILLCGAASASAWLTDTFPTCRGMTTCEVTRPTAVSVRTATTTAAGRTT